MACGYQDDRRKKNSVDICNELAEEDKEKYLWKFILDTRKDEIEKALLRKQISLALHDDCYIATVDPENSNWKTELSRTLNEWSCGFLADTMNCEPGSSIDQDSCDKVKRYSSTNKNEVWVVGEQEAVKKMTKERSSRNIGEYDESNSERDIDKSWDDIKLIDIPLSRKQQALIYLHRMWDLKCLKRPQMNVIKEEKDYTISLRYQCESDEEKIKIKKEIEEQLKAMESQITETTFSLDPKKIAFLSSEIVYCYVDKELNYSRSNIRCVWYIDEKTVTIFVKGTYDANGCVDTVQKCLRSGSMKVPEKYFQTDEAQQKIRIVESKFKGKLKMCLSSSFSTLHYICTGNEILNAEREIKTLFATKTVEVFERGKHNLCKKLFKSVHIKLEQQYKVGISEKQNEQYGKYGFEIKGDQSAVQTVQTELELFVKGIQLKEKDYKIDHRYKAVNVDINECISHTSCEIVTAEISSARAYSVTDLQDEKLCYVWKLPNGNNIKIINTDDSWQVKDSLSMQIRIKEEHTAEYFHVDRGTETVCLYLPQWRDNVNKEKEILQSLLNSMYHGKTLEREKSRSATVLILREPEFHNWPWEKFLKQMLPALRRYDVEIPFIILEPTRQIFEKASNIIQGYASSMCEKRIKTKIKTGNLATQQVDAIVNSSNEYLTLDSGAVSKTILSNAGYAIQEECNSIFADRRRTCISSKDVIVTKGYNLPCELVFHGALAPWSRQTLAEFVNGCLKHAELSKLSSIAFPSLGTGNLKYPAGTVAKIMFQTVDRYVHANNFGSLKEVHFVIFEKDVTALKAFRDEEKRLNEASEKKESLEKGPNPTFLRLTVTGQSMDQVDEAFSIIEDKIKSKNIQKAHGLPEPERQVIDRDVYPSQFNQDNKSTNQQSSNNRHSTTSGEPYGNQETELSLSTGLQQKATNRVQQFTDDQNDREVTVCVMLPTNAQNKFDSLVNTLKKYHVEENQVIWCPYTECEAAVKFQSESDADSFIAVMKTENKYTVTKRGIEAVVNIRARLNVSICNYLQDERRSNQLKKQSGVGIVKDQDSSVTLTGSLYEISAARNILLKWKAEFHIPMEKNMKAAALDKQASVGYTTEPPDLKQQNRLKDIGNETVVVEPSYTGCRMVLETDNSLRIFVQPDSKGITDGKDPLHYHYDEVRQGKGSETELMRTKEKTTNYTFPPEPDSSRETPKETTTRVKGYDRQNVEVAAQSFGKFSKPSEESLMITTNEGIKVYVYKGDMRYLNVDCIVNSSNQQMIHSKGLSAIISEAAGPKMNEACNRFLKDNALLVEGQVCFSTAGNLKHYKGIVHVCSPQWDARISRDGFFNNLSRVIINSLSEANRKKMSSIAIPAVGSGGRGGPRQLCFSTYPNGIIEYSSKFGKTSKLKEVHLVDVNDEVVDFIRTACLLSITHPDKDKDIKLIKIPDAVKETFVSYIIKDETVDKQFFNMHLSNNVHVVVCDGALFSAYNHRHIQVAACDVSYEFSAVVITEDVEFTGKSRSAQHSLQRGGNDFFKNYEDKKKSKPKKKVGHVYDIFGDQALKYGYVFFAVMPTLSKKALEAKSSEQLSFFGRVADCFEKVLIRADEWKIGHLCLPVLGEDFFPTAEEYFMDKFVSDMFDELSGFASKRKTKTHLLIHIAVNTNKKLFRAFTAESDRRTRQKERSSHSPGQIFQSGGLHV